MRDGKFVNQLQIAELTIFIIILHFLLVKAAVNAPRICKCAKTIISYLGKSEAVAMVPDGVKAKDLLPLLGRLLLDIPVKLLLLVVAVVVVVGLVAGLLGTEHLYLGSYVAVA